MQPSKHSRMVGFTLIEIMVVIFVIGISITMVSLVVSRGGPDTELRAIAERFSTLGDFASERAILTGRPIGLLLEPPAWRKEADDNLEKPWRYRWQEMGQGGWTNIQGLEGEELPPTVQLDVTVEEQMWEWENAPKVKLPVAVFYPSGEVTRFAIEFRDERIPDFTQNIEVDDWGRVKWLERPGADREANNGF